MSTDTLFSLLARAEHRRRREVDLRLHDDLQSSEDAFRVCLRHLCRRQPGSKTPEGDKDERQGGARAREEEHVAFVRPWVAQLDGRIRVVVFKRKS